MIYDTYNTVYVRVYVVLPISGNVAQREYYLTAFPEFQLTNIRSLLLLLSLLNLFPLQSKHRVDLVEGPLFLEFFLSFLVSLLFCPPLGISQNFVLYALHNIDPFASPGGRGRRHLGEARRWNFHLYLRKTGQAVQHFARSTKLAQHQDQPD